MARYLLDTNHAATLVTPRNLLREKVFSALAAGNEFALCVPVITETLFGLMALPQAERNLKVWSSIRPNFECFFLDESDAETAAELRISLRRRGWQLGAMDAFIAVTALRHGLVLLTTDKDFQGVPGLSCENWRSP